MADYPTRRRRRLMFLVDARCGACRVGRLGCPIPPE